MPEIVGGLETPSPGLRRLKKTPLQATLSPKGERDRNRGVVAASLSRHTSCSVPPLTMGVSL